MRYAALALVCLAGGISPAFAGSCPGNPNAIGTSRTITVDPSALPRIGTLQYRDTLPLNDHEVVLTFDDGPLPPYTNRILDTLASECVKATYFLVGRMASAYPDLVRRIYNAGHTIGTHSQNHPLTFDQMALPRVEREVGTGIASVQAAVGNPRAVAPFFRIPGLLRDKTVETYLASQSIAVWSVDEVADDWFRNVTAKDIVRKAINRIEAKNHRGVLLLHDIHPATAMALPVLLRELKARGYHIVQAVPPGVRPPPVPERPAALVADSGGWPRVVVKASLHPNQPAPKTAAKTAAKMATKTVRHRGERVAAKAAHHRKRIAHNDSDPVVTSSIAKKKNKTKTAESDSGWRLFQR
jgi:peptidoglycan/xylan/chitin deacetylase (PgdA/CDA1 family)